ncbi:transmembrane protein 136-like [Stylonychia lemnae]|uniref:Transmembrane protein 136-like n=1 Tax=Stylonychia lemnae TaxID=5949 RepID=A0A078A0P9_STYLE|nr:transmembrane protein 136-like [Stylonychia lemnae]|eukprot:CDW75432.1 transmembrane protein 136-like [Stylonychia lemnae]
MDLLDNRQITEEDIPKLTKIAAVSFIFFWATYFVSKFAMSLWKSNKIYQQLSNEKKADYISRIVANIHAVIAVGMAIIVLFFSWYIKFAKIKHFSEEGSFVWNDNCLMKPSKFHSYAMVVTSSYLVYDLIVCLFLIRDNSGLMYQTYIHHGLGLIGGVGSVYTGYCNVPIKISTPFLNMRQMLLTQKQGDTIWYTVNSILFALSFFLFRILFYPITIYRIFSGIRNLQYGQAFQHLPSWIIQVTGILTFLYVGMFLLQVFWFKKILALVTRSLSKGKQTRTQGGDNSTKPDKKQD